MNTIRIEMEDFDINAEIACLKQSGDIGAVVTFTGVARSDDGIQSMTVEHYPGMTEREIAGHVAEAESRWPLLGITIIHRIGKLAPGDNIVLVAVASSHRQAAFAAAEFLMDYLKTRAPFWKVEQTGTQERWVQPNANDTSAEAREWVPALSSTLTSDRF